MEKAFIKKAKPTVNHGKTLRKLGYQVREHDDHFEIDHEGFLDELDLTGDASARQAALKAVVRGKKMLTYQTSVAVEDKDGEPAVRHGIFAAGVLDKVAAGLSCLIAKRKWGGRAKEGSSSLDDFLSEPATDGEGEGEGTES